MSTRTLLIVAGVAAVAAGVWYHQRRKAAWSAAQAQMMSARMRRAPTLAERFYFSTPQGQRDQLVANLQRFKG